MLGELEAQVMAVIWTHGPASVREVRERVNPELHYNTVLNIMERLEKKGVLARRRQGRAHVYFPRLSQEEFARSVTGSVLRGLIGELGDDAIAAFVDALEEASPDAVDRLRTLLRTRAEGEGGDSSRREP